MFHRSFRWVLSCCAVLALSSSLARADDTELQQRVVHFAYTARTLSQGTPPGTVADLANFFQANPQEAAALQRIKDGEFVVVWNEARVAKEGEAARVVLIYEKAAEEKGGLVSFADGAVRRLTADEFRAALKGESPAPLRTWTDSTGSHRTEAALVDVQSGTVRLRKKNGSLLSLSIERLSRADQAYVRSPASSRAPDSAAGLKAAIQDAIGLLEAKQYKLFIVRFMRPQDLQHVLDRPCFSDRTAGTTTGKKDSLDDFVQQEYGPLLANTVLQILKAVSDKEPTISDSGKKATFDLSSLPLPIQFRGMKAMTFAKYNSRWCLAEQ